MIRAYPLAWPDGWPRTPTSRRKDGRFEVSFAIARDELLNELRLLGAKEVVISTAIPTRKDGLPYTGRIWKIDDDPGVAVYFVRARKPKAIACDTYRRPEANLRALGLSVASLRALERYGVGGLLDRVFTGLDAQPSPDALDWRAELGLLPNEPLYLQSIEIQIPCPREEGPSGRGRLRRRDGPAQSRPGHRAAGMRGSVAVPIPMIQF